MFSLPEAKSIKIEDIRTIHIYVDGKRIDPKIYEFIKVRGSKYFVSIPCVPTLVVLWTDYGIYLVTTEQELPRKGKDCFLRNGTILHADGTEVRLHEKHK